VIHPKLRLKYVATINNDALGEDTDPDYELQYIDIGNVDSSGQIHEVASYRFADAPSRARRQVLHGDVIVSCVRTYLQAIAPIENPPDNLIVSTGFAVVRPMEGKLRAGFCKYALREPNFLAEVERRSVGVSYPAINSSDLAAIPIPAPSDDVQRRVESFLDRETARIDALVAAKQRLLDLLAEKRKAIIATAVTRGFDPNVKLRDPGAPWLGEIPGYWPRVPLRYLVSFLSGGTPDKGNADFWSGGTIPWVSPKDMKVEVIDDSEDHITEAAVDGSATRIVPVGSVLVVVRGMILARTLPVAVTSAPLTINQDIKALVCGKRLLPDFLRIVLGGQSRLLLSLADSSAHGTKKLETEVLQRLEVPTPSLDEQRAIVDHIARETAKLDAVRAATERTIALLTERRAAQIAAAVTGQINVGEAA
jgi:type I restriction enzyme, S subunit